MADADLPSAAAGVADRNISISKAADSRPRLLPHQIKHRHKLAARSIVYMLTACEARLWIAGAAVWEARLTPKERIALVLSVGLAMDPKDFAAVSERVLASAGAPPFGFLDAGDAIGEACLWADLANRAERRAYALACFMALSPRDKADFLETAGRLARGQRGEAA